MGESFLVHRNGIWAKPTDAILQIKLQDGAYATISKNGITHVLTPKTRDGRNGAEAYCIYIVHESEFDSVNPWTISASKYGFTRTTNVIVNSPSIYTITSVHPSYIFARYNSNSYRSSGISGTQPSSISGVNSWGSVSLSSENDYYLKLSSSGTKPTGCQTGSYYTYDLSEYTGFVVELQSKSENLTTYLQIHTSRSESNDGIASITYDASSTDMVLKLDISDLSGDYYGTFRAISADTDISVLIRSMYFV